MYELALPHVQRKRTANTHALSSTTLNGATYVAVRFTQYL
jgi:hypothetical protein